MAGSPRGRPLEIYGKSETSSMANHARADQGLIADELERKADQDSHEKGEPRRLHRRRAPLRRTSSLKSSGRWRNFVRRRSS